MNNNIMEQYKLYSKSTVGFCNTRSVCMFYWFFTFMFYIFPASKKHEKPSRICQVVHLTLFSLTYFVTCFHVHTKYRSTFLVAPFFVVILVTSRMQIHIREK